MHCARPPYACEHCSWISASIGFAEPTAGPGGALYLGAHCNLSCPQHSTFRAYVCVCDAKASLVRRCRCLPYPCRECLSRVASACLAPRRPALRVARRGGRSRAMPRPSISMPMPDKFPNRAALQIAGDRRDGRPDARGPVLCAYFGHKMESADAAAARHPAALCGVACVLVILITAVCRLTSMAMLQCHEPSIMLGTPERYGYMIAVVFFGYSEGYKALCVQRALTLSHPSCAPIHRALAPFYVMGLIHTSRRRLIMSWTVIVLVSLLVVLVRHVPYPQRSMLDAGAAVGLGWAIMALVALYARVLAGFGGPGVDSELPNSELWDRAELAPAHEELGAKEKSSTRRAVTGGALTLLPLMLELLVLWVLLAGGDGSPPAPNPPPPLAPTIATRRWLRPNPPPSPPSPPSPPPLPPLLLVTAHNHDDIDHGVDRAAPGAMASGSATTASGMEAYITGVCAHYCVACPQAPSATDVSKEWYAATKPDGERVACIPSRTREGRLCFCDDS